MKIKMSQGVGTKKLENQGTLPTFDGAKMLSLSLDMCLQMKGICVIMWLRRDGEDGGKKKSTSSKSRQLYTTWRKKTHPQRSSGNCIQHGNSLSSSVIWLPSRLHFFEIFNISMFHCRGCSDLGTEYLTRHSESETWNFWNWRQKDLQMVLS